MSETTDDDRVRELTEAKEKAEAALKVAEDERDQAIDESLARNYQLRTQRLSALSRAHRLIGLSSQDDHAIQTMQVIEEAIRSIVDEDILREDE